MLPHGSFTQGRVKNELPAASNKSSSPPIHINNTSNCIFVQRDGSCMQTRYRGNLYLCPRSKNGSQEPKDRTQQCPGILYFPFPPRHEPVWDVGYMAAATNHTCCTKDFIHDIQKHCHIWECICLHEEMYQGHSCGTTAVAELHFGSHRTFSILV